MGHKKSVNKPDRILGNLPVQLRWLLISFILLGGGFWVFVAYDLHPKKLSYLIGELPMIFWEVNKLSGAFLKSIDDERVLGETMIRLNLEVDGKGPLVFLTPRISSFTGGGPLQIIVINKCRMGGLGVAGKTWEFQGEKFVTNTIQDVVDYYVEIQRVALNKGLCGFAGQVP
jgi:hypothetical protein